ncbi:MAG TPA: DUF6364 family protein [Spirochaetota bacterium]|nr:DUF6364 family protein [Spirochaetota bacterium]
MGTKLTLTLDDSIIRNAKKYAKTNKISLSKMVEFYFKYISSKIVNKKYKIPPITKELSGLSKF